MKIVFKVMQIVVPVHFSVRMIGICVNICGIEHDSACCRARKFEKEMKKLGNMNISCNNQMVKMERVTQ